MKKILLMSVALLAFLFAQAKDVPAVVQKAFEEKFKGVEKVKWDVQKDGRCDASFKWNDRKCTASFSEAGQWLRTETTIPYKEVPLNVKKVVNLKFTAGAVKGASKIEKPEGISYGIELKPGWTPNWFQFAEDGTEM
jgi:hypothetical protein